MPDQMPDMSNFTLYSAAGRAQLSKSYVRSRLTGQRALMTEAEQVLLAAPYSAGGGMMERQFWTLGFGDTDFVSGAGDVVSTSGYAVAIATEDVEDMGDRGPSTFFVPASALSFMPTHPPQLAPTAAAQPSAASPTGGAEAPQPNATTTEAAVTTPDTVPTPGATQPTAAASPIAPPPGMQPLTAIQPDGSAGGVDAQHTPVTGLQPNVPWGHAGFNPSFAGPHSGAHHSPFPPHTQHAYQHLQYGSGRGAYGAGTHPGHQPLPFGANAWDLQFQQMMGGPLPDAAYGRSPAMGASSPAQSFAARNPSPFRHATPPPTSGPTPPGGGTAQVTQLFSHVKPVQVVLNEAFVPTVTDPVEFARDMRKNLTSSNWDGQPTKDRVQQILLNVEASLRGLLEVKGAASMTEDVLFAQLARDYPARVSVSSKIEQLRSIHCTNGDNSVTHVATLITKFLAALGLAFVSDINAVYSELHAAERFETLATLIMNSLPPDAQTVFRLNKAAMISACRGPSGLAAIEAAVVAEYSARSDTAARNKPAQSYMVSQDKLSALVARIKVLESEKSTDSASDASEKTAKPRWKFDPKNMRFDPAKAKRPCRLCEHDPQSVGDLGPGMHWHYKCPFAKPEQNGSDEE